LLPHGRKPVSKREYPALRNVAGGVYIFTVAIKISIVEDNDWIRNNLAAELNKTDQYVCIGTYRTGEEALQAIPEQMPEVVIMDINLPGISGIECVRKLKAQFPSLAIIMLTVYEESEKIFQSLVAGASGYLLKRNRQSDLLEAIEQACQGGSPMSGPIARKVVQYFNRMGEKTSEVDSLTRREREILEQLAQGAAYKEIADSLALSIDTVRMHIKGIYSKLHVHSRGEAVAKFLGR
jgi:DNA-binding NarL/FixJ family response regulator